MEGNLAARVFISILEESKNSSSGSKPVGWIQILIEVEIECSGVIMIVLEVLSIEQELSIEEVGAAVGIPQSYNYSKWFKAVTNMTPFRYRKEYSK